MNRILIIDDDRELCALIKRSVQTENIAADFCNTGKEGLPMKSMRSLWLMKAGFLLCDRRKKPTASL